MAETYDLYFGTESGKLTKIASGLSAAEYDIVGSLRYNATYYWRVDAVNEFGTTEGDEWFFYTLEFDPPLPSGVTLDENGNPTGTATGENFVSPVRRLVAAADNAIWLEDI